jgi:hypothetical protein
MLPTLNFTVPWMKASDGTPILLPRSPVDRPNLEDSR